MTDPSTPESTAVTASNWRPSLRWFAAEIAVVVVGILIALALNAWWQGRQANTSEGNYLTLIRRDLGQMLGDLEELREFEEHQLQDGLTVYRILSSGDRSPDQIAAVSQGFSRLLSRRTMSLANATYEDLLSTGNLQIIEDRVLRDRIVAFYEEAERQFEIHNKNNSFFVDELFVGRIFGPGLFYDRMGNNIGLLTMVDSALLAELTPGYIEDPDRIWSLPDSAPEWSLVKAQLLVRIRVAAYAQAFAVRQLVSVRELQDAVEVERAKR